MHRILFPVVFTHAALVFGGAMAVYGQAPAALGNRPERLEWFSGLGYGMFIHWSVDSQLGMVISHSLAGADEDYCRRFFEDLPKTFRPARFDADEWADLAAVTGFKYVVFAAKHHAGFCMYDTNTTDFKITNTPFRRDVLRELLPALRRRGIAVGLYFSPDDFWFLHRQGRLIDRNRPGVDPQENEELMRHDLAQLRELLTNYGKIDVIFLDGRADGLRELCWELQPEIVVTRGAMETPEEFVPGVAPEGPWETCATMGTQWQYKPTNESYKSGTELIQWLIEARAKGGNLLLNVGPQPDGVIPLAQQERLREIGLWLFINSEAICETEPWTVANEGDIWFTRRRGADTVYAIVTGGPWKYGERREITLRSVRPGPATMVSVLGHHGQVLEYHAEVDASPRWRATEEGLVVSAMRAQRIYNDLKWPNPVVLKITDAHPAIDPPTVATVGARATGTGQVTFAGRLAKMGDAAEVQVGIQVRKKHDKTQPLATADPWREGEPVVCREPQDFAVVMPDLEGGQAYEYRAYAKYAGLTRIGDTKEISAP